MTRTAHVAAAVSSTTPAVVTATPAADTPVVTLAGIVTDIRTWLGLPALPANSPIPALPIPDPFASLWMGVRQIEHRINNRTPTANPTSSAEDPQTGAIAGNLNATDLDGDPLIYAVTTAPTHGKVTVNTNGSYAYTPDADFALSGGSDGFSVRISEANAADHIHGIKGLVAKLINALSFGRLHVPDGSTTTAVVQLVVTPISVVVDHAPVAPTTQGPVTYDPTTGIATGNLGFTDPDGDPLTYTVTATPTYGAVTVATNGTYTYTPTAAGRAQAATTPGLTDTFTVTASDGQLTTPTNLQVNVTPAAAVDHAPVAPTTQGPVTYDPTTGIATGNLGFTDPDGDPLTYTVTATPTYGAVTVATNGTYTYTPTAAGRAQAATTPGLTDTFTVTASDGQLTTPTNLQVNVTPAAAVDHAPVAPTTQGPVTYDPTTGIATGNLGFTDPDGDPLTYTVTATPTYGAVTVATNGTYTYTPTAAGRAQAATTPGLTDTFTVTASDGQLTTPTNLQVNVTPAAATGPVSIAVGINPEQAVVTPDGSTVYVTNNGRYVSSGEPHVGDSVSVISTATDTVIKTIQVGRHPAGLAITPDGSTVYVTNFDDNTVSVISTATNTVIATIPVGGNPGRVIVTANGSRALVINTNSDYGTSGSLSVVDTATNTVTSTIALVDNVTLFRPSAVVANSDGSVIYVTNRQGSYADVIVGGTVTRLLYTGGQYPYESTPVSAVLDGNTLYIADIYSSQVTVVDLAANGGLGAITRRINAPLNMTQIIRSLDGGSLYIAAGNTISQLDVATGTVTTLATVTDASFQGIALSPDGTVLYATNPGTSSESDDTVLVVPLT